MASKKNNEIMAQDNGYMQLVNTDIAQMMAEELDGLDTSFERIKIPSAGSTVFEVPGEDPNNPETVKEFSAVILYHHPLFAYYKSKYTGGNNPPDCGSFDGMTGEGSPGGNCSVCPNNKYGSGENNAKACKNRRRIFVLREGEIFPLLLSLPTGSLKEFTKYIKRLLTKGRKSSMVVTRFSLQKASNSTGIAYSQAQFTVDRVLSPEEQPVIAKLSEQIKTYSKQIAFEVDMGDEPIDDSVPYVDPETGEIIEPLR